MLRYEDKTLEELDGEKWEAPKVESYVMSNCHRLRRVPLKDFRIEDLRLMIGQEEGLKYLLPLAVAQLEQDPFVQGDFYPGDLLKSVLGVSSAFWQSHPELKEHVHKIVKTAKARLQGCSENEEVNAELKAELNVFS